MKNKRILLTLLSVLLIAALSLTAFAGVLAGDVNGDGKITVFDAQMIAETKAERRQLSREQAERAGELSVRDVLDTVLTQEPAPTEPPATTEPAEPSEPSQPQIPADAIAAVTNEGKTQYVSSVADMESAVSSTGNTQIKLLKNVNYNAIIQLPYSCSLDLNSFTIRTNPNTSSGIEIAAAGSANKTTTIKNGKLVSYYIAIKVMGGSVTVDNMTVETLNGPCVGLYDPTAGNCNTITNATLVSPSACVHFMRADTDYSATTMHIANADLICNKNVSSCVIFARNGANCKYGDVIFGDNVNLYAYVAQPVLGSLMNTFFGGEVVVKESDNATVTVGETTYSGLKRWTTEPTNEPIKILMIGNSFCLSFTEELYALAKEAGKDVYICNLYYGGCSVERHWKSLTGEWTTVYDGFYVTDAFGRKQHGTIRNIKDAVHFKEDWDIITLQQHFDVQRTASLDVAKASVTPYAENLYNYMRQHFPDAELYWHQTWAYEVGYKYPNNRDDDPNNDIPGVDVPDVTVQNQQRDMIIAASDWISETYKVDQIPCGAAWAAARANPNIQEDPCKSDFCHDGDVEGGQYLNACTWFETLFGESCVGSKWRPSNYTLQDALAVELQKAAHQAVADLYGEDYAK